MDKGHQHIRSRLDDGVLTVTLDNPPTNAMVAGMHRELLQIFAGVNADTNIKCVVLTGAGDRAFCAGGDIGKMIEALDSPGETARAFKEGQKFLYALLRLEKPVIARINGHAIGLGATLALFCDLTYAVETAKIGDPHVSVGLTAGDGGALIWPQLIGYARAREFLLTGEPLLASEAAAIGLITRAVPASELDAIVDERARKIAKGPSVAINTTKQAINMVLHRQFDGLIEAHSELEMLSQYSRDHAEAAHAFLEKRKPVFKGN